MSIEKVKAYFKELGIESRVKELDESSATVALAAQALGVQEGRIAKTLSFLTADHCILIVMAGDAKVDNRKYKDYFSVKAKMLSHEDVTQYIGHDVGGVCPFAVKSGVDIYLDVSMKRFDTVLPACGSSNSMIEVTLEELQRYAKTTSWIDVCKGWQ